MAVFATLVCKQLYPYIYGPHFEKYPTLIFAGFYNADGANGKFSRSGNSSILDSYFFEALNELLEDHRVKSLINIKTEIFKPPRIIYSNCDYEGFQYMMRKYSRRCLTVLWGIIDETGNIQRFEFTTREGLFAEQIFSP